MIKTDNAECIVNAVDPDVEKIREDFPVLGIKVNGKPLIYLDNAATTQKPESVIRTVWDYYTKTNSNIHRGIHFLSERASASYENARKTVKSFINAAASEEIIFTHGTTDSINLVAQSFGDAFVKRGDEIVITELEHHSNFVPWQRLCSKKEAKLRIIPINDDGSLRVEYLDELMCEKTRLISLCHVSNTLGTINPVKEIVKKAHARDIPVLIDGAQAAAHLPVDVKELDCDFYAFSGHKMFAETGIGVLYGKEKWLESMPPYQSGGGMINAVKTDSTTFAEPPFKFEAGTPNICGAVSLQAAVDYIRTIDINSISRHESDLLNYAVQRLSELDGVVLYGPNKNRCGALSFNIGSSSPYDAAMILDKLGIAVRSGMHCAQPVMDRLGIAGTVRASFAMYNTKDEVDMLAEGVRRVQMMLQ